jgi:hypothetical protein
MKKKTITLFFSICLLVSAQLFSQDLSTVKGLDSISFEMAEQQIKKLVLQTDESYYFVKSKKKRFKQFFYFLPTSIKKEDFNSKDHAKMMFKAEFYIRTRSDNTQYLKFARIVAPFKDVFQVWKNIYSPASDMATFKSESQQSKATVADLRFAMYKLPAFKTDIWQLIKLP